MAILRYDRAAAVRYAHLWAMGRNPRWGDFSDLGGDCANFISQCLYEGSRRMNYTRDIGWYYRSMSDRAPAWTGVVFLHRFLTRSDGEGVFARRVESVQQLQLGDVVFLSSGGRIYHSLLVLAASADPPIAAHTVDSIMRPLSSYENAERIFMRIEGVRTE